MKGFVGLAVVVFVVLIVVKIFGGDPLKPAELTPGTGADTPHHSGKSGGCSVPGGYTEAGGYAYRQVVQRSDVPYFSSLIVLSRTACEYSVWGTDPPIRGKIVLKEGKDAPALKSGKLVGARSGLNNVQYVGGVSGCQTQKRPTVTETRDGAWTILVQC